MTFSLWLFCPHRSSIETSALLQSGVLMSLRFTKSSCLQACTCHNTHKQKDKNVKSCPIEWAKFGMSCYFKSTERKIWSESRDDCQSRGANLVLGARLAGT
uniref:C-type lectin domain-containing protein n=1 Tax=Neolamprologus brichardi TaxID=32507 RepID=A0A3Q4HNK8_NEOBR